MAVKALLLQKICMFFENHLCKSKKLTVIHAHCFCHGVYINRAGWIPPLGIAKLTGISTGNHTANASTGPYKAHPWVLKGSAGCLIFI